MSAPSAGSLNVVVITKDAEMLALFQQFFATQQGLEARYCSGAEQFVEALQGKFVPQGALVDFNRETAADACTACRLVAMRVSGCKLFLLCGSRETAEPLVPDDLAISGWFEKPVDFPTLMAELGSTLGQAQRFGLEYTQFRQPESAEVQALAKALERNPDDLMRRGLYAFSLYTANRYKEAVAEYAKAIRGGGRTFLNLYYMGQAFSRLTQYANAVKCWQAAIAIAPSPEMAANVARRIETAQTILNG